MIPNPLKYAKAKLHTLRAETAKKALLEKRAPDLAELEDFSRSLRNPTGFYEDCFAAFHKSLDPQIRQHRHYFNQERRGFGEDAFHVMWWLLVNRFHPGHFLEIGVYRGQAISLVSLLAKLAGIDCTTVGISPFSSIGDSVSTYRGGLDYHQDTLDNFAHFSLPKPELFKAYSTDPQAVERIHADHWDMIYIDGNHDYDIVLKDWQVCSEAVKVGGIIVLDDSALNTSYTPPPFATGGHPGPSRLASEIDTTRFEEILKVGHNRVFQRLS